MFRKMLNTFLVVSSEPESSTLECDAGNMWNVAEEQMRKESAATW